MPLLPAMITDVPNDPSVCPPVPFCVSFNQPPYITSFVYYTRFLYYVYLLPITCIIISMHVHIV